MAIDSLNETKTLLRVADFLGVKPKSSAATTTASKEAGDKDKIDDSERAKSPGYVPVPPASGF